MKLNIYLVNIHSIALSIVHAPPPHRRKFMLKITLQFKGYPLSPCCYWATKKAERAKPFRRFLLNLRFTWLDSSS